LVGAAFLGSFTLLAFLLTFPVLPGTSSDPEMRGLAVAVTCFWAAIAFYAKARLDHIRTIRRHRGLDAA
jgi:hypothetical protein